MAGWQNWGRGGGWKGVGRGWGMEKVGPREGGLSERREGVVLLLKGISFLRR